MKTIFITVLLASVYQFSHAARTDAIILDSVAINKFYELVVSSSVNVVLVNSNLKYAYIKGTAAAISSIQIKQVGKKLYISRKGIGAGKGKVFVYLPVVALRDIEATDGAKVSSYDPLNGDTLVLSAYDQSSITIMTAANIIHSASGKNGVVEIFSLCNYSFNQRDENGISFIEFRKNGPNENL